jgi:fumarylpyruvate hydrolase
MPDYLFPPPVVKALAVSGSAALYPVHRVFCVGRNYAAHAAEMGQVVDREKPFYFLKGHHTVEMSGATAPYPPGTEDYHFEMELVLALSAPAFRADVGTAAAAIGYVGCGLDMTRRDLQISERKQQRPWDLGKDVERSAILAPLTPAAAFGVPGPQAIRLTQNGTLRQDATLAEMVWSPAEIVSHLSRFYHLGPGDLILTGTPAGVGPVAPGDVLHGTIEGLVPVDLTVGPAD